MRRNKKPGLPVAGEPGRKQEPLAGDDEGQYKLDKFSKGELIMTHQNRKFNSQYQTGGFAHVS